MATDTFRRFRNDNPVTLTSFQRLSGDGTVTMMIGTVIAGITTYAWQAAGTRTLGRGGFAPVGTTWTIYFLVVTIVLAPIEQFATRSVATDGGAIAHLERSLRKIALVLLGTAILVAAGSYALRGSLFAAHAGYAMVCTAIVLSLGQLAICRGILAGRRKFAAYGWLTGLDSAVRLLVGVPIVLAAHSALGLAWTVPLCSLVALLWIREWPSVRARPHSQDGAQSCEAPILATQVPVGRFLATTIGGTSAAQVLLAGGPLVLAVLGGSNTAVTDLFITQTAFRAAFLIATPVGTRSLPPLTGLALRREYRRLGRIALWLLSGSLAVAAAAALVAAFVAPAMIAALFGSGVRPPAFVAATLAAGTVLAIGNLGLNQILVAAARTQRITVSWWFALAVTTVWVLLGPGDPINRVSSGFVIGETVALLGLVLASNADLAASREPRWRSPRSAWLLTAAPVGGEADDDLPLV